MEQLNQMASLRGFTDFFTDNPLVNEATDFIGDATDFVSDPSAIDFFEIVTPAITEDLFNGGGLDDLGFIPGLGDVVDGDGFQIPFGPTIGPNAPSDLPGPTPGVPIAAGMPTTCSPPGTPIFNDTPYFEEKKKACQDEAIILNTMKNWIEEKQRELDSVKNRHGERQTRFNEECGDMDIDMEDDGKPPATTRPGSPGSCGCGGYSHTTSDASMGTQTPCGCDAGTQTPKPSTASTGTQTPKKPTKTYCNAGTQTAKTKKTIRCTQAVIDKCCPGPTVTGKRKAKDDGDAPKKKAKTPAKAPTPKRKESTSRGRPCNPVPKKKTKN